MPGEDDALPPGTQEMPEAPMPAPTPDTVFSIEFALDPAAAARLPRHIAVTGQRQGRRPRSTAEEMIWHDTAEGTLAARGLAWETPRRGAARHLLVSGPTDGAWLPGTPPALQSPDAMPAVDGLVPVAAFTGRRTRIPLGTAEAPLLLDLVCGKLRTVAEEREAARVTLSGPAAQVLALARRLAADLPLLPATAALAEEGRALARGERPRPRRRGAPDLGTARTVEAALVAAIGHLLECLLYNAPLCRVDAGPEGVHQARVALRRLRSVLKALRPAAKCAAVDRFDDALRDLARVLGDARDLDVFLLGVGQRAAAALPADKRMRQLVRVVEGRRAAAYAALQAAISAPGFRALVLDGMALAIERPWQAATVEDREQAEILAEPARSFGARLLDKRWHKLCAEGEQAHHLDEEGLHELRLTGKRLRYAAELFAPFWAGKAQRRFLKRLAVLQEELGLANDVAVARALVAGLGTAAPAWAVGAVEGFAVARLASARRRGLEAWENLMLAKPFWSDV